jgi:hypothetical protein
MFQAGYLFKPTHKKIHYVREEHGQPSDEKAKNFTLDEGEAKIFATHDNAYHQIMNLMMEFEPHDEYRWTPVTINTETGRVVKLYHHQWHG